MKISALIFGLLVLELGIAFSAVLTDHRHEHPVADETEAVHSRNKRDGGVSAVVVGGLAAFGSLVAAGASVYQVASAAKTGHAELEVINLSKYTITNVGVFNDPDSSSSRAMPTHILAGSREAALIGLDSAAVFSIRYDQSTETQLVLAWYKHYANLRLLAGIASRGPYTEYSDMYEILNNDGELCVSEPTVCTYRLNTGSNQQPMSWCDSRICMSATGVASNVGNWAGTVHIILTVVPQQYDDVAAGMKTAMKDHYPE